MIIRPVPGQEDTSLDESRIKEHHRHVAPNTQEKYHVHEGFHSAVFFFFKYHVIKIFHVSFEIIPKQIQIQRFLTSTDRSIATDMSACVQ